MEPPPLHVCEQLSLHAAEQYELPTALSSSVLSAAASTSLLPRVGVSASALQPPAELQGASPRRCQAAFQPASAFAPDRQNSRGSSSSRSLDVQLQQGVLADGFAPSVRAQPLQQQQQQQHQRLRQLSVGLLMQPNQTQEVMLRQQAAAGLHEVASLAYGVDAVGGWPDAMQLYVG